MTGESEESSRRREGALATVLLVTGLGRGRMLSPVLCVCSSGTTSNVMVTSVLLDRYCYSVSRKKLRPREMVASLNLRVTELGFVNW